jgi:hypothetical protein
MDDFDRRLADARARMERASAALRGKHQGGEWAEFDAAHDELLEAERARALALGEECATACFEFPSWDVGAPLPHLLSGARGEVLIYIVKEVDPTWDGSWARVADTREAAPIAVVRFKRLRAVRLGAPNDEVISGHPLYGRGLAAYRAHIVANSRWVQELQKINSVHSQYDPARWVAARHYLLAFHDETFECVADGVETEVKRTSLAQACRDALEGVLGTLE